MADLNASLKLRLLDEVSATARQIEARMRGIGESADAAAAEASHAFEKLRLGELQAAAEAQRLAGEIRRLQAAGGASAEQIEQLQRAMIRAKRGAAEYATEARRLAAAQQQGAAAAAQAAASQAGAAANSADATRRASRAFAEKINLISEMSLGVGALSPKLQTLAVSFAGVGNNAFQLANFMGPVGIAITSLITILPGLIAFLRDTGSEMDRVGSRADVARQRLEELREAERRASEEREARAQRTRGEQSSREIEVEIRALEARRDELRSLANEAIRRLDRDQQQLAIRIATGRERRTQEQLITALVEERNRRLRSELPTASEGRRRAIEDALAGRGDLRLRASEQVGTIRQRIGQATAAARRLAPVRRELQTVESGLAESRQGYEAAVEREAREARRTRVSEAQRAAGSARERLSALLVSRGAGISESQRQAIARLEGQAAQGLLGTSTAQRRLARLRDPEIIEALRRIQVTSVTAARTAVDQETGDVSVPVPPPSVERVRRVVRGTRRGLEAPSAPTEDMGRIASSLEQLVGEMRRRESQQQRVEVRVRADDGLRADVDASAADPLGGQ